MTITLGAWYKVGKPWCLPFHHTNIKRSFYIWFHKISTGILWSLEGNDFKRWLLSPTIRAKNPKNGCQNQTHRYNQTGKKGENPLPVTKHPSWIRTCIFPHTLVVQPNQNQTLKPLHFKGKPRWLYLCSVPADEFKHKSARTPQIFAR